MIGIKAIPAHFGGFETAADEISRGLVRLGYKVRVYNRSGMSAISGSSYEGVELVDLPEREMRLKGALAEALSQMRAAISVVVDDYDLVATNDV